MPSITTTQMLKRLRRALAKEGYAIRKSRTKQQLQELGEFFVVDLSANAVIDPEHDIESLELMAREMRVVQSYEGVVSGEAI